MATYGLQTVPGSIAFTGFTPTLGAGSANTPATTGTVQFNGVTQSDAALARIFRKGGATAGVTKLLYTLLGAASGSAASKTTARVTATVNGNNLGAIPIETVTTISRNTTAADLTAFQALLNRTVYPSTYVADASGNGGGGKFGSNGAIW